MNKIRYGIFFMLAGSLCASGSEKSPPPPTEVLESGSMRVVTFRPDTEHGFYRGTRFDWSGMISSVHYQGHEYFSEWASPDYPEINHGAGPAEEFDLSTEGAIAPPGYASAKPSDLFLKIGVGWLQKDSDEHYNSFKPYTIVDAGVWKTLKSENSVSFTHELGIRNDLGAWYQKTVSIDGKTGTLIVTHRLKNIGRHAFQTVHMCHNFLNIDGTPVGTAYRIEVDPELPVKGEVPAPLGRENSHWRFQKELDSVTNWAFTTKAQKQSPLRIAVANVQTGGKLEITLENDLQALVFWATPEVLCPEPFVKIDLQSGEEKTWTWTYQFFSVRPDSSQ